MKKSSKNPIKEIILSISFDKTLNLDKIKDFCEDPLVKEHFPNYSPGFDASLKLTEDPSSKFQHTGYILKSDNLENGILNVKLGRISYHIVGEYRPYDRLLEELNKYWTAFQKQFKDLKVSQISARYINQIDILKGESYNDYVTIKLDTPFKNIQGGFINFSLKQTESIKSNVIIANNDDENLILDLIVEKRVPLSQLENIDQEFIGLRSVKNNLFSELVTDKTKEKFEMS